MTTKKLAVVSIILVLAMVGVSVWVAALLPGDARLPIHWDANGQPNGFAGKWTALLMPAGITAILSILFYCLPALEPRQKHLQRSQGLVLAAWAGLLLVNVAFEVAIVSGALHGTVPVQGLMLVVVGIFFVLIGNQFGKSRSMFLVGIRTPWTLSSEDVWIKTNRLGGKVTMIAGVVMVIAAFAPLPARAVPAMVIALAAVMVAVPFIYSYLLWRREQASGHISG